MYLTTSKRASDFGPSRLPDIEFVCKYMLNTRRFSTDVKKILRVIGVPDLVSRESEIRFCIDAEGKIPE